MGILTTSAVNECIDDEVKLEIDGTPVALFFTSSRSNIISLVPNHTPAEVRLYLTLCVCMCVCACICMCVYMCVYMCVSVCVYTFVLCVCIVFVCVCCLCVCVHGYMHAWACVCE